MPFIKILKFVRGVYLGVGSREGQEQIYSGFGVESRWNVWYKLLQAIVSIGFFMSDERF